MTKLEEFSSFGDVRLTLLFCIFVVQDWIWQHMVSNKQETDWHFSTVLGKNNNKCHFVHSAMLYINISFFCFDWFVTHYWQFSNPCWKCGCFKAEVPSNIHLEDDTSWSTFPWALISVHASAVRIRWMFMCCVCIIFSTCTGWFKGVFSETFAFLLACIGPLWKVKRTINKTGWRCV